MLSKLDRKILELQKEWSQLGGEYSPYCTRREQIAKLMDKWVKSSAHSIKSMDMYHATQTAGLIIAFSQKINPACAG